MKYISVHWFETKKGGGIADTIKLDFLAKKCISFVAKYNAELINF